MSKKLFTSIVIAKNKKPKIAINLLEEIWEPSEKRSPRNFLIPFI
jgi:hypothetical protein